MGLTATHNPVSGRLQVGGAADELNAHRAQNGIDADVELHLLDVGAVRGKAVITDDQVGVARRQVDLHAPGLDDDGGGIHPKHSAQLAEGPVQQQMSAVPQAVGLEFRGEQPLRTLKPPPHLGMHLLHAPPKGLRLHLVLGQDGLQSRRKGYGFAMEVKASRLPSLT